FADFPWRAPLSPAAAAEQPAPSSGPEPGAATAAAPQSEAPATVAAIDGFRQARFGMTEDQLRQAIKKDFPAAAAKLKVSTHPSEKTTVLTVTVADLLPQTGTARVFYVLGYKSKKLIQVNIVWASEST